MSITTAKTAWEVIRDETAEGLNTAARVGGAGLDIIDAVQRCIFVITTADQGEGFIVHKDLPEGLNMATAIVGLEQEGGFVQTNTPISIIRTLGIITAIEVNFGENIPGDTSYILSIIKTS